MQPPRSKTADLATTSDHRLSLFVPSSDFSSLDNSSLNSLKEIVLLSLYLRVIPAGGRHLGRAGRDEFQSLLRVCSSCAGIMVAQAKHGRAGY